METATLNALLSEAGPLLEADAVTAAAGGGLWTLEFEDEAPLNLERCERPELLLLSGTVAALPEHGREGLYELLLSYNGLAVESGGARFALNREDGVVELAIDLAAETLTVQRLCALVQDFRRLRRAWQPIVGGWPGRRPAEDRAGGEPARGLRV